MEIFDLLMDSNKVKEEWKFVLMATGLLLVMMAGLILGTLVKLCWYARDFQWNVSVQ